MFENNNRYAIRLLARKSFKNNQFRNQIAIAAIVLTTLLFTSLFTVGISIMESMERQLMRQSGDQCHGSIKYLTKEQYELVKKHPLIEESGYHIMVGIPSDPILSKRQMEVHYEDAFTIQNSFHTMIDGHAPTQKNEIALDTIVLDLLKLPHTIGTPVTIHFNIDGSIQPYQFILSGYYQGDYANDFNILLVSKSFANQALQDVDVKKSQRSGAYPGSGLYTISINFDNHNRAEEKLQQILSDCNITAYADAGVNWAYQSSDSIRSLLPLLAALAACMFLALAGYLLIYNIFYISIRKDTRFYGLLKTLGATKKQIRRLLYQQAILLSIIGIPIGLILGYGIGLLLVPILSKNTWYEGSLSINPSIFIGSAIFSVMTIWVSCRKPGRLASACSPIEAMNYMDTSNSHSKSKRTWKNLSPATMALDNLKRGKRKTILVLLSFSLTLVFLNSLYSMIIGFDMDKFVSGSAVTDYQIYHMNYSNAGKGFQYDSQDQMTKEYQSLVLQQPGITDLSPLYYEGIPHTMDAAMDRNYNTYFTESYLQSLRQMNPNIPVQIEANKVAKQTNLTIYGGNRFWCSFLTSPDGSIDYDKLNSGNYILAVGYDLNSPDELSSFYYPGDEVTITYHSGKSKTYQVLSLVEIPDPLSVNGKGYRGQDSWITQSLVLPEEEFLKQVNDPYTAYTLFNMKPDQKTAMEQLLNQYTTTTDPEMAYRSKQVYIDQFHDMVNQYRLAGGGLLLILAIIGLLNFLNTMSASILARRREFAMLESIGMTKRQQLLMILIEGISYAILALLFSATIGQLLSRLITNVVAGGIWYYTLKSSLLPLLVIAPFLLAIAALIPVILLRRQHKNSLISGIAVD